LGGIGFGVLHTHSDVNQAFSSGSAVRSGALGGFFTSTVLFYVDGLVEYKKYRRGTGEWRKRLRPVEFFLVLFRVGKYGYTVRMGTPRTWRVGHGLGLERGNEGWARW